MDVFEEMGIADYGILLSEKDSIVYPRAIAPELRVIGDPLRVHRVSDYSGVDKADREARIQEIIQIAHGHGYNAIFAGYLANDFFMSPMAIDIRVHHVLFCLASLVNGASAQMPFTFLWLIVGEASTVPLGLSKISPEKWRSTLKMIFLVVFVGVRCVLYPVGLLDTMRRIWLHNEVATASSYGVVALLAVGLLVNLHWAKIILSRAGDELSTMALRGMFNRFCAGAKFTPAAARGTPSASPSKGDAGYEVIESAEGQLALAPGKLSPGRFFYNLVRGGDNYLGEAYVRGEWFAGRGGDNDGSLTEEGDALARLLRKLTGFLEASESLGAWAALLPSSRKRKADLNKSVGDMNIEQAETSVAAHYDVDQEALLYKTFLDPGMVVSVEYIHVYACIDGLSSAVSQYHAYTWGPLLPATVLHCTTTLHV